MTQQVTTLIPALGLLLFCGGCAVVEAPFGIVNSALTLPVKAAQTALGAPAKLANAAAGDPAGKAQRRAYHEHRKRLRDHDAELRARTERKKAEWARRGESPVPEDRPTSVTGPPPSGPGQAVPIPTQ
jgi:hypothetical protein